MLIQFYSTGLLLIDFYFLGRQHGCDIFWVLLHLKSMNLLLSWVNKIWLDMVIWNYHLFPSINPLISLHWEGIYNTINEDTGASLITFLSNAWTFGFYLLFLKCHQDMLVCTHFLIILPNICFFISEKISSNSIFIAIFPSQLCFVYSVSLPLWSVRLSTPVTLL